MSKENKNKSDEIKDILSSMGTEVLGTARVNLTQIPGQITHINNLGNKTK